MGLLLLLFIVVPLVELALLIEIGGIIGTPATLLLIVVTGIVGATLARIQGMGTLARVREASSRGELPADALFDGVLILIAAAVLMTPGVLTDLFGFFCLIPACRRLLKEALKRRFLRAAERGAVRFSVDFGGVGEPPTRPVKNVTPDDGPVNRPEIE